MDVVRRDEIIQDHFIELLNRYPGLVIRKNHDDLYTVAGVISFVAEYNGKSLADDFYVEITLSQHYPDPLTPPSAKELGGVIQEKFHVNPHDGTLCLGASLEVKKKFSQKPTLLGFTENLLIPFLYSFKIWEKTGKTPYGELSHGADGIIEYYENLFQTKKLMIILFLLKTLADNCYRGHLACPCGSGEKLRNCHGKNLLEFKQIQPPEEFLSEYYQVLDVYLKSKKSRLPHTCISKYFLRKRKKKR